MTVASVAIVASTNVANFQSIRRLVLRSLGEGGSLGAGGLVLGIGIGNISTFAHSTGPQPSALT